MRGMLVICGLLVLCVLFFSCSQAGAWDIGTETWDVLDSGFTGQGGTMWGYRWVKAWAKADTYWGVAESVATCNAFGLIPVTKGSSGGTYDTTSSGDGEVSWSMLASVSAGQTGSALASVQFESTLVAPPGGQRSPDYDSAIPTLAQVGMGQQASNAAQPWGMFAESTFTDDANVKLYLYVEGAAEAAGIWPCHSQAYSGSSAMWPDRNGAWGFSVTAVP